MMASGIYGRRIIEPQISDHRQFLGDQYSIASADRKLSSDLENVWDKVSDAKAVLQKLEHRMEVTEDANKAENLAFKMTPASLPKNTPEKLSSSRAVPSVLRGSLAVKGTMQTSSKTNNHKVGFHEPLVLYHKEFEQIQAGRLASIRSPLSGTASLTSFIARDLRSNDYDVSRVTVRDKPVSVQSDMTENFSSNRTDLITDENTSPVKGTVIPPRVLNGPSKNVLNLKSKSFKPGRNLKSAGVAKTVTHFNPKEVYKYLEKEGIQKHNEKTNHRGRDDEHQAPLFLDSPHAPYKRIDIVKQKKGLQRNSEALARLKEKIQKQKERSPSSMDSSLAFGYSSTHKEDDPIVPNDSATGESKEKPRMRKIAQGPAAPKYKGFSATETKIKTPDGKVWKTGEANIPYIPTCMYPDVKKSRAVSSLFNDKKGKSKQGLTSGRLKCSLQNKAKPNQSKNLKPVRKTGKICPEDPVHKKSLITPSSWREGQKVAESILGPPPKQRKNSTEKDVQRPNSPPTRDTDLSSQKKLQSQTLSKRADIGNTKCTADASAKSNKNASANYITETGRKINEHSEFKVVDEFTDSDALVKAQPLKSGISIKASIPREKLSPSVQGILDDLHLSSSDSEEESIAALKDEQPKESAKVQRHLRGRHSHKHLLHKDSKPSNEDKASKVRHYDQNQVQQYIAKQKAERKRKQSQERKNQKEAQEKRQKQLEELYRKQKEAACMKKKIPETGKNRPVLQDTFVKSSDTPAAQAMQKINDILTEPSGWKTITTDSDKENTQEAQQPSSKFDEKMSAFMEKLNQYDVQSKTLPETEKSTPVEPIMSKDMDKRRSQAPKYSSTSEFMQKLDRYLNDEVPITSVRLSKPQRTTSYTSDNVPETQDPNLMIEDLDIHTSPGQLDSNRIFLDRYGDLSGTYGSRFTQGSSGMDPLLPAADNLTRQKSKAERIAVLKAKAESLQDRIQAESKRLMDNPVVPVQPKLEQIDSILTRSGGWSTSQQWLPETTDRQSKPQWQNTSGWDVPGIDIPDSARSRGGVDDISPSQLPGVAGLRHHVTVVEENKKETDAALKIQSAYRGHIVRLTMNSWKLPSGQSMTEVRRHATSTHNFHCNEDYDPEDDNCISEGPLSSRSDIVMSEGPELRSVEEILKEMKEKEYCIADPIPAVSTTPEWQKDIKYDDHDLGSQRNNFLADLENRLDSAKLSENFPQRSHTEESKPPWERTGGDKYSLVNVFTSKYLKALKKHGKDDNKPDVEQMRKDPLSDVAADLNVTPKQIDFLELHSISKNSDHEITDPHSSSISENISLHPENSQNSYSSITSRSPDMDANKNDISSAAHRLTSKIQASKVNYSSSDDEVRQPTYNMIPSTSEHKDDTADYNRSFNAAGTDLKKDCSSLELKGDELPSTKPFREEMHPKVFSVLGINEKKYSPAALEQRMTAELNYQEAVEESLRHLTGVERTQGVSLAQQETVSLAQLLKARQLQHEVEMERLTMKAKEEALEAEERRQKEKLKEERFQMEENIKLQKATRKSIETQAEASRLTAKAAERLSYRFANRRDYPDSLSSYSVSETITRQKDSSSSNVSDDSVALRKDIAKGKEIQRRSPSLMSEHSTTSMRPSDNDSHSSILEQLPSTEEEDTKQALQLRKEVKDKSDGSDSLQDERKTTAVDNNEGSDKSISEDLEVGDDISEVKDEDKYKKSSIDKKAPTDHPSDSSEYSVCFDESLTEDEIAEISRRVVVPSESHRRYQRRRSPHIGALDKSDISSDDQPSSVQQKTPRSTTTVRGLDDFSIGPSLSGADESEFAQFMNTMVRQYMLEEEVRSKHQAAMLKLRERAIKEKTESELAWLKQQKQQTRNKGEDDKMPPIRKKQRAILMRLKLETDEIKKLQAVGKAASHERKLFLQQHQENTLRRSKTRQPEENKDKESGMDKTRTKGGSDGQRKSSTPVPKLDIPDSPEADDVSELNSDLDVSSASSILLKKLKKHIPSKVEESRLTKREQRLFERRKQAEQLLAWKKRLDKEEKKVYDIEKQALSAWEKESDLKSNLPYYAEKLQLSARHKPEDVETQHCLKGQDLSRIDESSSGKSPNSENHSSPPPASHSESSIAEEIIQINSGTNSSRSVISSAHDDISIQRNQEESSDGTNAEDYNQSFESLNTPQQTPRSPKSQDITPQQEKLSTAENIKSAKKDMKKEPDRTGKADSPASTPLLPPYSRSDKPVTVQPGKITGQKDGSSRRKESVESWSDESFSQTQSETEHSDIECRVRALKEELKKRRFVAERLKKEQKRRHKDRLKAQEASLRSQIEAYDVFIRKTQNELTQELDHQHQLAVSNASSSSAGTHVPVAKPQIRSPRKNDQARQSARSLRSATAPSVSPEASPRSGSTRTTAVNFLNKNRTESESSGKSSRSLSFEDDEKTAEETTPNGSIKSMVGSQTSPLPSKQEKLPMSYSHTPSPTTPISDKVPAERPKRLDLTEATATLSKLTKPPSVTGSLVLVSSAQRSHIPIASKTPSTSSSSFSKLQGSHPQTAKSLIPVLVSSGSSLDTKTSVPQNQKQITSPPSPGLSESYSEDFESSAGSKKNQENGSIATEDDISEHFSDSSTATDKSDKSEALLDLSTPSKPKITDVVENKDDSLLGITDFAEAKHITADEEDEEKTPVVSPSQTPIMSPRTPTIEKESKHEISPLKFSIGDRVLLAGRESGIVRFIGETEFAKGTWVGAELELPKGKNDGSVFNIRYFTCQPKHGLFAPLDRVTLLSPVTSPSSVKTDFKESSNESELSKAISDAAKNFETFAEDLEEPIISPVEKDPGTSANRDTLAEELSNKLLNSLLQDSVTTVLDSHAMKQKKVRENIEDKEDDEQEVTAEASIDDEPLLPTPVKNFLQMLSTVPVSMEGDMEEDEDDSSVPANTKESLAETFTGDLLADTLSKVLEIRRQRAKKWSEMSAEHQSVDDEEPKHQRDLDNGREVEDILQDGKPSSRTPGKAEVDGQVNENDRDREAPVRPVSPVFGTSQDDIAEEWFDEDFGISSFHKMKPNEAEDRPEEDDIWQDGRLIEVFEPPPPVFLVPHKQQHILRLIEEAVEYYYSKHLRGELSSDVRIPDFLYNDQPDEISVTEEKDEVVDEERLESECNTNHVFKTSLFDLVRELITEIYSTKTTSEESKRQPPWLKKKTAQRPQYCRRLPKTGEELLSVVTKHVSDLLNLQGEVKKLDPKMTMKWGSRKKKDKVDLILIQELREEEPEWTNYDEDETTVKMQLTDTVLDMLLSDTVMCLEAVERKRIDRNSPDQSLHITKSAFCDGAVSSGDDRSQ